MDKFVNLHLHSDASLGDSIIKIPDLVDKLQEYGQEYVALTDHSSCMNHYSLEQACMGTNVKPLFGNEFYCKLGMDKPMDRNRYHLIAIAMSDVGLTNINKMQRIAVQDHFYYKPLLPHDILFENTEDVFISTACSLSWISQCILNQRDDEAYNFLNKLLDNFGSNNVAIELQYHPDFTMNGKYVQNIINAKLIELYDNIDCKYIINTFDSHVLEDKDRIIRKKIQSIGYKKPESEINDTLKSNVLGTSELSYRFAHESGIEDDNLIQKCIDNTYEIAQKCYFEREDYGRVIPKFDKHKHFKEIFLQKVV